MPITKWSYQITTAAEIPTIIAKAFYSQFRKNRTVLIDITKWPI